MLPLDPEEAVKIMCAAGYVPLVPYPGASLNWPSRCTACEKEVAPRLSKVKIGQRCKCRAHNAPVDPKAAREIMLAADLDPLVPYPGRSNVPWLCRCLRCGNEVTPRYGRVQSGRGRSCGSCKSSILRELRLAENSADQAISEMQAVGFVPLVPFPGTNSPWLCKCVKCGKQTRPRLTHVRGRGDGCGQCARNARVEPRHAEAVMLVAGFEPLEPFPGSNSRWRCRCLECGTEISPTYYTVKAGGGCRACGVRGGFKPNKAALVYLIYHETHHAIKVGIGNVDADRLDRHRRCGWVVLAIEYVSGERAPAIERDILDWWRKDLGLPPYLSESEMPSRGWTETVDADAIDILSTIERIKALAASEMAPVST